MKFLTSASLLSLMFAAQSAFALGGGSKPVSEPGVLALLGIGIAVAAARYFKK